MSRSEIPKKVQVIRMQELVRLSQQYTECVEKQATKKAEAILALMRQWEDLN